MGFKLMSLGNTDKEITNIVQLPAIVRAGEVQLLDANLLKLDEKTLKMVAQTMGGELIYMKLRATYTELESPLCGYDGCYRPTNVLWCDDHPNGIEVTRTRGHMSMVNPRPYAS